MSSMVNKGKEWLKTQDWKSIATSPIGLAFIGAVLWSVTHKSGLFHYLLNHDDGDDETSHKVTTWHVKESVALAAIVFGAIQAFKRFHGTITTMSNQKFEDPPVGSEWMIIPKNATIMLPGETSSATQGAHDARGPPPSYLTERAENSFLPGGAPF